MTEPSPGRPRLGPALVVQALLAVSFGSTLVIPLSLTEPPSPAGTVALALALTALAASLVVVLRGALPLSRPPGAARWAAPASVALTLVLWLPMHSWAQQGQSPWAWLAGMTIAACALAGHRPGLLATGVLGVAAVLGGVLFDRSGLTALLTALGCGVALWLMCQVVVWLLRLLVAAEAERSTQAELAVAQERLRASRELHDVLGHRLGIITLKAELTADLARRDPARAAAEAEDIQHLAAETLAESRRAIHGETTADLTVQLSAAELVLTSAGINATVEAEPGEVARLPNAVSHLLAAVLREAVTNVLRHSDSTEVAVTVAGADGGTHPCGILRIVNDGARAPHLTARADGSGTGLAALSARCSAAGGRLVAGPTAEGTFEVRVDLPTGGVR